MVTSCLSLIGDSGGPLFVASAPKGKVKRGLPALDLLVGITSAGYQTEKNGSVVCDSTAPGVYTNVSFFWDCTLANIPSHFHRVTVC